VGNVSMNVYAKFRCAPLRIKKALGIFRELIPGATRVAFWDPHSGSKFQKCLQKRVRVAAVFVWFVAQCLSGHE